MDKVELVNKLADEIVTKRKQQLRSNNKRWIPTRFYASSIGECDRQLVHSILDWDKRELADDGLLALFESGKKEENNIIKMLLELGFDKSRVYTTLELRMKCGVGKCGRCNVGDKFVCKDGPVFRMTELDELPDEY